MSGQVLRDQSLSVYHALGKLLHNKRELAGQQQQPEGAGGAGAQHSGSGRQAKAGSGKEHGGAVAGGDADLDMEEAGGSCSSSVPLRARCVQGLVMGR